MLKFTKKSHARPIMLACVVLTLCLSACKKNKDNSSLNLPELQQTGWSGSLSINDSNRLSGAKIEIVFNANKSGNYSMSEASELITKEYSQNSPFTYIRDGKVLQIDGGSKNFLLGDWWVIKSNAVKLVLVREIQNPKESDTLTITKTY